MTNVDLVSLRASAPQPGGEDDVTSRAVYTASCRRQAEEFMSQPGVVTPKAEAAYARIADRLATGATDWAITNRDAQGVIDDLETLAPREWTGVVQRMQRDGLFDTFAGRGLADSQELIDSFTRQVSRKLRGADCGALPSHVAAAMAGDLGAPTRETGVIEAVVALPFGVVLHHVLGI